MEVTAEPSVHPEKRILTIPNVLSLARLATVPIFLWLFVTDRRDAAVLLYGATAWTDFLDGYIARRTGSVTELGKLLDPLADRIFVAALAIALVVTGALPLWLAAVVVARDVVILAAYPVVASRVVRMIPVNFVGKTATAALFFGLTLLAVGETSLDWGRVADGIALGFIGFGAVCYWIAGGMYAREALGMMKERGGT